MLRQRPTRTARKLNPVGRAAITVLLASTALLGQPKPASSTLPPGLEFPAIMRQNVVAGKTPVGAKVQAKLTVATLVNGVVIPEEAILSGEVIESAAKSATEPSRLAIRMDSAQWKGGSVQLKVYLTAWYYPLAALTARDLSGDPMDGVHGSIGWNDAAAHPEQRAQATQPFPNPDRDDDRGANPAPGAPRSSISKHRVLMKNVESTLGDNDHDRDDHKDKDKDKDSEQGRPVTLTSTHFNIKLDRTTTYVFATSDLAAGQVSIESKP
jgi:hypothetical protein